jgi:Holliday junction resolvase RusA-like endonuclease
MGTPFDKLSPHVQEMIRRQDAAEAAKRQPAEPVRAEGAGAPDPAELRTVTITLPWPPSVNHYYVTANMGGRLMRLIGAEGKAYQRTVSEVLKSMGNPRLEGDLVVDELILHPPTLARRDLDNSLKALWDSLQDRKDKKTGITIPGLFRDDWQIREYHCIKWGCVIADGRVDLTISQIPLALFTKETADVK